MGNEGSRRCAVTSRDGVSVNQRFARAEDFLVFEVGPSGVRFRERRPRPPGPWRSDAHREALARLLADCQALVSLQFPGADRRYLVGNGFALHEVRGPIEAVVGDLLSQPEAAPGTPRPVPSDQPSRREEPAP